MENKTVNVNNPTQINIGKDSENSVQTIGRKIDEITKDTTIIATFIKSFIRGTLSSTLFIVKVAILPAILCFFIGITLMALVNNTPLEFTYNELFKMFIWITLTAVPDLITDYPIMFIIIGCWILYAVLLIKNIIKRLS